MCQPEFLCSRSDSRHLPRSGPCGHSGRLSEVVLTHYCRREVRNSINRYRKIHIDYRSKFSYRFISFISIIYGNTNYGRPIISAIGSPTEKISEFLDHFLQPFLADTPSFVKDTGHFLYILSKLGPLPQNTILVTLDVTSLYTNVPLLQAKQAVGRVLNRTRPGANEPSNQSLIRLLDFVFTKNVFTFSDGNKLHYFVQTNGVSMGSKCAPSVACTYMGKFERQHVYTYHLQPFLWLRYVDDVFCLWKHGDAALQIFVDHLNSREGRIKFTCHSSTTSVEFLDTTVHSTH